MINVWGVRGEETSLILIWFTLLLVFVSFLASACGTLEVRIGPTASPTINAVPTAASVTVEVILTPTPTQAAVAATETFRVPPEDLCREYLPLSVLYGEAEEEAVATSYRCHSATIDSTGQSPARSPELIVHRGTPIHLQLAVEQQPTAIDVRLYPGAGISASFLRWPEELPLHIEAVDRSQPEPNTRFQYLPQASPELYSLVVKVTWGEDVEVFYAISFTLEDAASLTSTRTQTTAATLTHAPEPSPTPTAMPTPASLTLIPEQAPDEVKLDVAGQIGGHSLAVTSEQGRIYLGIGPRLIVLDETLSLTEPLSIGQSEVLPGIVQDVVVVDNLAYIAAGDMGLLVLDVTRPPDSRLIGRAPTHRDAQGVVVRDGLAYVACGDRRGTGQEGGMSVIDVSEPEMPEKVTSVKVPGFAYQVTLIEQYAYVAHEGGLLVVDVSNPAAPVEAVQVSLRQRARDIAVAGGYAYVASDGLHVIDVSDPAQPRRAGHLETMFPPGAVAVQDRFAYLADTFCEMGRCGSTLHVVDMSDPTRPQEVGTWFAQSAVEDVFIHRDALYLASWQKGVQAVDVSDPTTPRPLGEYATLGSVDDVAVSNGYAYVSDGAESGLQVLDLAGSPTPRGWPRLRGTAASARWASGYAIVDGYAYVPVWIDGFRVIDVRDPNDGHGSARVFIPRQVAAMELGMAEQAVVVGERAYVTVGYEGLVALDVSDPSTPHILGRLSLDGLAEGLAIGGDYAYVTVDGDDRNTLFAIDVTDPSRLREGGTVALNGKGLHVALADSYAYVAIADCAYFACSGGLQVVDIRDATRPRTVVFIEVPGGAFGVAVAGRYVFVAAGDSGVWVVDVSDPENPRAAGWKDTPGRARNVVVIDEQVYVADESGGLLVLRAGR